MAIGSFICDSCGTRARGNTHTTLTGARICDECNAKIAGTAAGLIASHGDVGAAISTAGWYARLRAARKARGSSS